MYALVCVLVFLLSNIIAEPLRTVCDTNGDNWEEYFDENTQHFYYYNLDTKETSWLLEFSKTNRECTWNDGERQTHDVIDEMFPVQLPKSQHSFEASGVFPVDIDDMHMRKDIAGNLQRRRVNCIFDHLVGVQARMNYPIALKAPIAFHLMFISDETRQDTVAQERKRIEENLTEDFEDAEGWETLGHIWRVYGDVQRAMDCYRRAFEIAAFEKSSLFVSIAGLLDQMNYVQDALKVLDVMMTSFDAFSPNVESNLALGYMMAAQLHIRSKDKDMKGNLTSASDMIDTALDLHPPFLKTVFGLRQEIHYKDYSFGGPPWLFGGTGSWSYLKNPWLLTDGITAVCEWWGLSDFLNFIRDVAYCWPLTSLFLRKCFNSSPAVMAGIMVRFIMFHGSYIPLPLLGTSLPLLLLMAFCLLLSLSTEYFLADSLLLLLAGFLMSYEEKIDLFLRSIVIPAKWKRKKR